MTLALTQNHELYGSKSPTQGMVDHLFSQFSD